MKLTKQQEAEILKVHNSYWDYYLKGNAEAMHPLLDKNYTQVGSAETEVFSNKKDAVKFLYDTIDQVAGKLQMRNRSTKLEQQDNTILIHELCDLYALDGKKWIFYSKFRATTLMQQKKEGWKLTHQHSSFPDTKAQEGENIAIEKITKENLELRDAVKRRTTELEHSNNELKIEAALERVRTVAMAMQQPNDMLDICHVISDELTKLGMAEIRNIQTAIIDINKESYLNYEYFRLQKKKFVTPVEYKKHKDVYAFVKKMLKDPEGFFTKQFKGVPLKQYIQYMVKASQFVDPATKKTASLHYYFYSIGPGALGISSYAALTKEAIALFKRFRNVFQLAYRRFIDIEKATAQAKEAEIELALERVRARTMAMQQSNELPEAANLLFQQVQLLGMPAWSAGYCIWNDNEKKSVTLWMSSEGVMQPPFTAPTSKDELFIEMRKGAEENKALHVVEMGGKKLEKHYKYMRTLPVVGEILDSIINAGHPLPTFQIMHHAYFSKGFLLFITYEPVPDAHDIFKRFGKVFDQTYTRFLDLQKAEAQAKEAQIETSMERVRSKSMGMHKSDELREVVAVIYEQLQLLGFVNGASTITIMHAESGDMEFWMSGFGAEQYPESYHVKNFDHPFHQKQLSNWKTGKLFAAMEVDGDAKKAYDEVMLLQSDFSKLPAETKAMMASLPKAIFNLAFMKYGAVGWGTQPINIDQELILQRFAKVFEQTYTRFLDLQKAEAQTRESQIEAAMEKVRSRSLAMQKPEELTEVAELLRKEMGQLGVEELETSSIYIVDKENEQAECWYAIKDIREENKRLVSDEMTIIFADSWVGSEMWKFYRSKMEQASIVMKGDNRKEWINYCAGKSNVLQDYYGDEIPERTYHLVKFNGGYMGAASPGDISAESWDLLRRAASVFSLAYTRFNDLQIAEAHALQAEQDLIAIKEAKQKAEEALTELQATQKQLIQSEKMASLGELTAGIAHEIQNPLNFVNNFSEVSTELVDEMNTEIDKGNLQDAKEIANDLKQNLDKINHHGKRAGDIVKGMLQHSRTSSGQKESTAINALADEYLRLAYHGLRAKDKSFNATMKTEFDETIGNINIIPQDIGRVILNLITNAFYVVDEKKKQFAKEVTPFEKVSPLYEPTVSVSTKKIGDKIEIKVTDNGNGIPQKILDKIFQPFFTTKPTGQGTGLGLSLSYDIVKAHGGELKVETLSADEAGKEGDGLPVEPLGQVGTTFIIILPK